jgi:hypothetical protein
LFVLEGKPQDPYGSLIKANESDIQLVLINGVPRCGSDTLMQALFSKGESFNVGGSKRVLNFAQKTADPDVAPISLTQAKKRLTKALKSLPNLPPAPVTRMAMMQQPLTWFLALDELAPTGMDVRPHLPLGGRFTMLDAKGKAAAAPPVIKPLKLDAVTVVDDSDFFSTLEGEKNLPDFVKTGLPQLY